LVSFFGHFLGDFGFAESLDGSVVDGIKLHFLQVSHD
jgi:hypothetical protein